MGSIWFTVWRVLFITVQVSYFVGADDPTCAPGFQSKTILFKVTRERLRLGMRLGIVNLTDCTERTKSLFTTDDDHFMVQADGTLVVRRSVVLHEGHRDFSIHLWDSQGQRMTLPVTVLLDENHHGTHSQHQPSTEDFETHSEVLYIPEQSEGLRRRKRSWLIPPVNVPENQRGPYPILLVQIRSTEDQIKTFHYSIIGSGPDQPPVGLFLIERDSGKLYLTRTLDREVQHQYKLQLHAVEEGSSSANEPIEITVNVVDQNDNKPAFNQDTFTGEVAEATPKGFGVIRTVARDLDEPHSDNSDIRYRIVSQEPQEPDPSMFVINHLSGVISVNAERFDREKYPQYTLVVEAADFQGEGLTGSATVILTITDRDIGATPIPPFTSWAIPDIVSAENNQGPYPLQLLQDGERKFYYSISGPGADQPPAGLFYIDRNSGGLYVTQPFDRESQDKYKLLVHAVAEGEENVEERTEVVIKVADLNDNKPVFNKDVYEGEVAEALPKGFEVIKVEASDADEPDSSNSDIQYSIVSQEPQEPDPSMFAIDPLTGAITVNAGGLDREKHSQYTLMVQAADSAGKGLTGQTRVILTVTGSNQGSPELSQVSADDGQRTRRDIQPGDSGIPLPSQDQEPALSRVPPQIPFYFKSRERRKKRFSVPPVRIPENFIGPYPLFIKRLYCRGKKCYFNISVHGADQLPTGLFIIDPDSRYLYLTQPLDREVKSRYYLVITYVSEDSPNSTESYDLHIEVIDENDNKPIFTQNTFFGNVTESSVRGSEVITVKATDADEPWSSYSKIQYRIISQEPQEPDASMFAINPITGTITVNADGLDRKKHSQYTLVVEAADDDGKGLTAETRVIINVTANDLGSPGLSQDSETGLVMSKRDWVIPLLSIPENLRGLYPVKIAKIRSDADRLKRIIYVISGPGADLPPVNLFTMDRYTGALYVTEKLDREKQDSYIFQAHALVEGDFENAELPMDIIVNVTDQNDNKPVFTQSTYVASVPESSPMDFEILKVNATDADEPNTKNSDVRYRIMSQDPVLPSENMFVINSVTGAIRVNSRQLNRGRFPQYTLDLQASDVGGEGLTGNTKVIIKVTDKNNVTPIFTQSNHTCTTKTKSSKDDSPPDLMVEEHGQRLSLLELVSQNVSQRIKGLEEAVSNLQNANSKLSAKVLNLEGHSCRKNLRLLGLKESTETGDLTDFFASALSEIFGGDVLPSPLELDRAHRTSSPVPKPGDLPRPVILRFHKFQTKELIIREARQRGILHYRDQQIQIIEDYCPEVLNQWADYKEVMSELYNRGLMPSLEFPSHLRITLKGKKKMLRSIEEAWWFVDNHSATQPSQ